MPINKRTALLLSDPEAFATTLLVIAAAQFDEEFLYWDPETVRMEMNQELNATISDANFNKLIAAIRLVTEDSFYNDLPTFIQICNALYNGTFTPTRFDPADAGEISWGITEAMLIWPPDDNAQEPFAPAVVQYIGHAVREEGIMQPPDVLRLGVGGEGVWAEVQHAFADDPEMFAAIHQVEQDKTEEINAMVKSRLLLLLQQLDGLQIQAGEGAETAVQTMLRSLQASREQSDRLEPIQHAS